ncbi:MAG: magnesium protoporphyrin IX methyltransferase [Xanthobacteraceae bacterium]|jgi:magnesium-protoporphyrin O-methyltransferase
MTSVTYVERRGQIEDYFDRTAIEAWSRLTSDAPVNRIRATVRSGRDEMRRTLLGWLPGDMRGRRLLDAGCGTGALAVEAARRGAEVVAVDLSPRLIGLARSRAPETWGGGYIRFVAGDMLAAELGAFDHVVAMDSLIHYRSEDAVAAIAGLAVRARRSILFTFAPRTPALAAMHAVGRFFPQANRAPAIEPISEKKICGLLATAPKLEDWQLSRSHRVRNGFYTSQALELVRS